MLADKHTRNACSLSDPSNHMARGVPTQDALARTPLWLMMMKVFPSRNGPRDPKQADGNNSRRLALSLQASICPPRLLGHHPMVTSLLDQSEVIIWPMKDGDGKRTFELGTKSTKCPLTRLTHSIYALQANPAATHSWPKDLSHEPSQHNEPPIPGLSPSTKPPEDLATCRPEPEAAPTQSMEEPFGKSQLHFLTLPNFSLPLLCPSPARPTTPRSIIIINDTPVKSPPLPLPSTSLTPPPSTPTRVPSLDLPPIAAENPAAFTPPVPSSSHSYDDACQELTHLQPTLIILQAIIVNL
ncbi:hypothetical protein O181_114364 [Austropuccinia psidii MF-1]|uniref:Uncharacterized protein n=1 Tax=Austropuccinia psidii MF-1 TaxID=1389203 RepID=A0A9Q3K583_9BASI|nr:hypothetical protein [Austropuccinia psidii MF-1]